MHRGPQGLGLSCETRHSFRDRDNCRDQTAARARDAGATVLERRVGPAGKTYALAWTFETLAATGVDSDLYVVTDATARVHRGFLQALAAVSHSGEDIVVGHSVLASENRKWFAKCLGLTLVHRNLQNWARERLGLSSLIEGRGMAYTRRYIREYGWSLAVPTQSRSGQHPTEDWRHGVRSSSRECGSPTLTTRGSSRRCAAISATRPGRAFAGSADGN